MSDAKKQEQFRQAMANGTWYAACETGHPFWAGDDRTSYKEANADAKAHDKNNHGGNPTAVVLGP